MSIKRGKRWGISFNKLTSSQKAELSRVYTEYAVECIRRDGEGSIPLICAITNLKEGENWTVSFLETLQKNLPSIYGGLNPKDALWDEAESPRSTGSSIWLVQSGDIDVFCEMYEIEYFVKMLRPAAIVIKKMKS